MKRCSQCRLGKPGSEFSPDKTKADGLTSACKPCRAKNSREYYERTNGVKARERYNDNRDVRLAQQKAWKAANPDRVRESTRRQAATRCRTSEQTHRSYMKRHGGQEEWDRLFAAQEGRCYLCERSFRPGDSIHVDHDHACCPGARSCPACRRGLAHAACNQIVGLIGEDMAALKTIIANFEPVQGAARDRIMAKAVQLPLVS